MNNETPVLYGVWRNSWERHQLAAAMGIERTFGDYAKAGTREEPLPEPKPLTRPASTTDRTLRARARLIVTAVAAFILSPILD